MDKALEQLIEAIRILDDEEAIEFLEEFFENYRLTNDVEISTINALETFGY